MSEVKDRFKFDVRNHEMRVELDQGVHRSILFKNTRSFTYSFRLITWPGALAISGDCEDFIFRRIHDMFDFFRFAGPEYESTDSPNYGYWSEKVTTKTRRELMCLSDELYEQAIRRDLSEHISGMSLSDAKSVVQEARWDDLMFAPNDTREAIDRAMQWRCPVTHNYPFNEFWDNSLEEYSYHFKWVCHAIQWGVKQYDLTKSGRTQKDHDEMVLRGAA